MKVRRRALALILSFVMVLTFMPTLAFADDEDPYYGNNFGELPAAESLEELPLDEVKDVEVTRVNPVATFIFIPEISGTYIFEAYSTEDTIGAVRTGEETIATGDDDVEGNFRIMFYAEEGTTYYLQAKSYYASEISFQVRNFYVDKWAAYAPHSSYTCYEGQPADLSVYIDGDTEGLNFTYSWYYGNDEFIESSGSSFIYADKAGDYYCVVDDGERSMTVYFTVERDIHWDIDYEDEAFLENGKATLKVWPHYYGDGTPEYTYKWFERKYDEANDSWTDTEIAEATTASYAATKSGKYRCEVTIKVSGEESTEEGYFTVYGWKILNDDEGFPVEYGKSVTLTVKTNYTGNDMTYQWYRYEDNPESGEYEKVAIEGATKKDYTINNVTQSDEFKCVVKAEGHSQEAYYYIYIDTSKYDYQVTYPDATATYTPKDGRELKFEYRDHGEWSMNFPRQGDTITVKYDNNKTNVYTCNNEDSEYFESDSGEKLYFEHSYEMVMASAKQKAWAYTRSETNHNEKKIVTKFDIEMEVPITVTSHVKSIKFEPANIRLSAEDVKVTDNSGDFWYSFDKRAKYTWEDGTTRTRCWAEGDKLTVDYNYGTSRVYTFDPEEEAFVWKNNDATYVAYPSVLNDELSPGNNTIKVWFDGLTADIAVYVDATDYKEETKNVEAAKAVEEAAKASEEAAKASEEAARKINSGSASDAEIADAESKAEAVVKSAEDVVAKAEAVQKEAKTNTEKKAAEEALAVARAALVTATKARSSVAGAAYSVAKANAEASKAAADSAAFGTAEAVTATQAAKTAADTAKAKAEKAKAAAQAVVAAMDKAGANKSSAEYQAAQKNLNDAETALNNATKEAEAAQAAVIKAENDKADAEAAAQKAADEALEWNGTLNKKIPAAKSVKVKAGKKKVTVSWTKATKKNLKKFDTVEVQVCTNKKFAKENTIRKTVKKSKKSVTISKLKKNKTYYVRVRNVKGKGTTKTVSKWSKVKKVKIKK